MSLEGIKKKVSYFLLISETGINGEGEKTRAGKMTLL
jgi:hypothetical protein